MGWQSVEHDWATNASLFITGHKGTDTTEWLTHSYICNSKYQFSSPFKTFSNLEKKTSKDIMKSKNLRSILASNQSRKKGNHSIHLVYYFPCSLLSLFPFSFYELSLLIEKNMNCKVLHSISERFSSIEFRRFFIISSVSSWKKPRKYRKWV